MKQNRREKKLDATKEEIVGPAQKFFSGERLPGELYSGKRFSLTTTMTKLAAATWENQRNFGISVS